MSALSEFLNHTVASGRAPGAVAVIDRGGQVETAVAGRMSVDGAPMVEDAIVRIQSMTKAVVAVATLRLAEAGRLRLDDPVDQWLPELAGRSVLLRPEAELDDVVPADRPITIRDLLTCQSGYGSDMSGTTPIGRAMVEVGVEGGWGPAPLGAGPWLDAFATLPLTFQPGRGWRYHHSFPILGILLSRLTGRPLGDHLADDVFGPLGMVDSGQWVPEAKASRVPAAYTPGTDGLVEIDAAAGGHFVGRPDRDVSHGELVSTAADYLRFTRMLRDGGLVDGERYLTADSVSQLHSGQVNEDTTTDDDFFPHFWDGTTWGFGVAIERDSGRYGWTGGLGTDFVIDPATGVIGILLTQVELLPANFGLLNDFQALVR